MKHLSESVRADNEFGGRYKLIKILFDQYIQNADQDDHSRITSQIEGCIRELRDADPMCESTLLVIVHSKNISQNKINVLTELIRNG